MDQVLGQFFDPFLGFFCLLWPLFIVVVLVGGVLVAIWLYKDANRRGENGIVWTLIFVALWIFTSLIGGIILAIVWLAARKPDMLCDDSGNPLPGREAQYAAYHRILNIGEKRLVAATPAAAGWTATRPAAGTPVAGAHTARTTCPSCGRVFDYVPAASGPTDVKCPSCGTEGSI